jgi:hypothetical protein
MNPLSRLRTYLKRRSTKKRRDIIRQLRAENERLRRCVRDWHQLAMSRKLYFDEIHQVLKKYNDTLWTESTIPPRAQRFTQQEIMNTPTPDDLRAAADNIRINSDIHHLKEFDQVHRVAEWLEKIADLQDRISSATELSPKTVAQAIDQLLDRQ